MVFDYFFEFAIAIFLGGLIGLQREYNQQHNHFKKFAGFRTFILISFLGSLLGYFGGGFNSGIVIVGFMGIISFSLVSYYSDLKKYKFAGITTEIALILGYLLGVLCGLKQTSLAIVFGILVVVFLAFKESMHEFAKKMQEKELFGIIKFALISLVILPILPNKNYSLADFGYFSSVLNALGISYETLSQIDVFNFYHIWLFVILISGMGLVGYYLVKYVGANKGYGILGFVGGIVSSTAVTISMAGKSKSNPMMMNHFILATILATTFMFIRVLILVLILDKNLISSIIVPLSIMGIFGFLISFFFLRKQEKVKPADLEFEQPFSIIPALKFAGLFLLILVVSKVALIYFGSTGILITSILSGLTDIDSIVLSVSQMNNLGQVENFVASLAILFAVISNTFAKGGIAYFLGNKKFGLIILGLFLLIASTGILALVFI